MNLRMNRTKLQILAACSDTSGQSNSNIFNVPALRRNGFPPLRVVRGADFSSIASFCKMLDIIEELIEFPTGFPISIVNAICICQSISRLAYWRFRQHRLPLTNELRKHGNDNESFLRRQLAILRSLFWFEIIWVEKRGTRLQSSW